MKGKASKLTESVLIQSFQAKSGDSQQKYWQLEVKKIRYFKILREIVLPHNYILRTKSV